MRVDLRRLSQLLRTDVPAFYIDKFELMGPLFNMDLSGSVIYRIAADGSRMPLGIRAPIANANMDGPKAPDTLLLQAAMSGRPSPTGAYVEHWWMSPRLSLDMILPGDFYELFFMKDYGTDRGERLALYGTTRRYTCHPRTAGFYLKFELYEVPYLDPARWFHHRESRLLRYVRMWGWYSLEDYRARM